MEGGLPAAIPRCIVVGDSAGRTAILLGAAGWRVTDWPGPADAMVVHGDMAALGVARTRATWPILLVPPSGFDSDARAAALRAGAGDVAPEECGAAELIARLEALVRRASGGGGPIRCGGLAIDPLARSATRDGRPIRLLPREYALLHHLAGEGGRPVSRTALLARVWNLRFEPGTNVVEVHVSRLRAKLDRGFPAPLLHTVKGRGYALAERPPLD